MKKLVKSYKFTFSLYIMLIAVAGLLYMSLNSIREIRNELKVLEEVGSIRYTLSKFLYEERNRVDYLSQIENKIEELKPWFKENKNNRFYIGPKGAYGDYNSLMRCWSHFKSGPGTVKLNSCYEVLEEIEFSIHKLIILKGGRALNLTYLELSITFIIFAILIFIVRHTIYKSIKESELIDEETMLYNRAYFLNALKNYCHQSKRYGMDIVIVTINIKDKGLYKNMSEILHTVGGVVTATTRISDISARVSDTCIAILLPHTEEKGAENLVSRLKDNLIECGCREKGSIIDISISSIDRTNCNSKEIEPCSGQRDG